MWHYGLASVAFACITTCVSAVVMAQDRISIEGLLKSGWQIAGFTAARDNRSSFILFRHPKQHYLVTCRVGYDVTRTPRAYSNCYKLK